MFREETDRFKQHKVKRYTPYRSRNETTQNLIQVDKTSARAQAALDKHICADKRVRKLFYAGTAIGRGPNMQTHSTNFS